MSSKEKTESSITKIEQGFQSLDVSQQYKNKALENIKTWLQDEQFCDYQDQIIYLIDSGCFELLLDSFYQVIPFGTGGRRGPVGIGPNRINPWAIMNSAQGHSTYLHSLSENQKKKLSIVLCYDVRKYPETNLYSNELPNPIRGITSKDLALNAIQVYAANGIKCYLFNDVRSTPELSYAVRHLNAAAGIVISASHNPKEDNGKKVYGADGGQLIPPEDQQLADIVNSVRKIKSINIEEAKTNGLVAFTSGKEIDDDYIKNITSLTLVGDEIDKSNLSIVFSPLHGVGMTSVYKALTKHGFNVSLDDLTAAPDGFFSNVKFNIPNPEVVESMETLIEKGKTVDADILINSDPDADRLGLTIRINGKERDSVYRYFNGNEIGIVLTNFVLEEMKKQQRLPEQGVLTKTTVTSELISKIAKHYGVKEIGDLLVGFKYIANEIKKLEEKQQENRFILGMEESHGFLVGAYCRDKDAAGAALLLCELASQLKAQGKNINDYLNGIYKKFGYHSHQQTSLVFLGAEGKEKIERISSAFRNHPPEKLGKFKVIRCVDRWKGEPFLSDTDKSSRNVLSFFIEPPEKVEFIKITARPSGTEPKIKIYVEVGGKPVGEDDQILQNEKEKLRNLTMQIIDSFTKIAYDCVGINMPERGFRLSTLLPVEIKLKYFEVEKELLKLENQLQANKIKEAEVKKQVDELLSIFGQDPVEKISDAFREKTGMSLQIYFQQKLKIN